jgi:carboxylesterase
MPKIRTIRYIHSLVVIIPTYLLLTGLIALIAVDIEMLHSLGVIHIVLAILLFLAAARLMRLFSFAFGRWVVAKTTKNFTPEWHLNRFFECRQISHCAGKKREQIVLLFHGFTTSPMEWDVLAEHLEQQNIDFHAPLIYGFGQINHEVILAIRKEDWFRQVIDLYDLFAERYSKISVVGHSMGGMLACYLAQHRPVHELIISAPALFPQKQQGFYARAVRSKLATFLIAWCIPVIPKPARSGRTGPADTMDIESTYSYFQYLVAPVRLLFAMLQAQLEIDVTKMDYQRLTFLYGAHDITVDNLATEQYLQSRGLAFQRFKFRNSAHNTFIDFDRRHVNELVVQLLRDSFAAAPACEFYEYTNYLPAAEEGEGS